MDGSVVITTGDLRDFVEFVYVPGVFSEILDIPFFPNTYFSGRLPPCIGCKRMDEAINVVIAEIYSHPFRKRRRGLMRSMCTAHYYTSISYSRFHILRYYYKLLTHT